MPVRARSLAQKVTESGGLPDGVKDLLKVDVDQISKQIQGEVTKQIENITRDAGKEIEKAVGRGIGDLIKVPGQEPPK